MGISDRASLLGVSNGRDSCGEPGTSAWQRPRRPSKPWAWGVPSPGREPGYPSTARPCPSGEQLPLCKTPWRRCPWRTPPCCRLPWATAPPTAAADMPAPTQHLRGQGTGLCGPCLTRAVPSERTRVPATGHGLQPLCSSFPREPRWGCPVRAHSALLLLPGRPRAGLHPGSAAQITQNQTCPRRPLLLQPQLKRPQMGPPLREPECTPSAHTATPSVCQQGLARDPEENRT